MSQSSVHYQVEGRVATLTLSRPERLNAIDQNMPGDLEAAVARANADDNVHVLVLTGAGRGFCSGYDLKDFAENPRGVYGSQEMPWDPMVDYALMKKFTEQFMSLFRSYKPVIAKVNGPAVAGGSDIALCCDLIVMADEAVIGYPPARVWGCPTTAMWVYRLGPEKAKRMLLTGDLIDGREAQRLGLVYQSVPGAELDAAVEALTSRMQGIPKNQLMMQKLMINQAFHNMGLETTQMFATLFDGITRHSPEGVRFKARCEDVGFAQAVRERDSGAPIP
ncbi:crotonase/enoyl-CoA hydratase family protein [Pseudomonas sp. N040]|uniref:crotonase/enoyl-CoA hydratase family protein n=1 Tax=Pseudomonas sp. N040 TaxID=2785325 RepID=UPI0018A31792|nr:crotonase/enoyl-CoA hydratase family protein [Pseudomonas sp. N040]MBF7729235.1 crotonase/enoyl-CoA hydratase family protein [Pseudomonas sp. N040]MBW7012875.1 crotonase/enoyl-CoA hydratase family protein [Pseudomonas sp. N040]